ncbi:MAG: winged helix-turn-helix domain-containing protein [Candidatus Woesearchaeota archaeon]|jgi:predicted transcriptional regulator
MIQQRITIIKIRQPIQQNLNEELQWFGTSLGLFNLRDKDKSCFRIFIELLKTTKLNKTISSDELAKKLILSRGTVVHHINKLMETGLVIYEHRGYMLRVNNLSALIDEIEEDMKRTCVSLRKIADNIDKRMKN